MEIVANILGFFATLIGTVNGHAAELPQLNDLVQQSIPAAYSDYR